MTDLVTIRPTHARQRRPSVRRLTHACVINVSYPMPSNGRGTVNVPAMKIGGATLPLLAALVRLYRPDCKIRMWDEIGTPIDFDYIDGLPRENTLMLVSVRTNLAYESRSLARRLRKMGFAVVMGGPHVSACIDEVATYANAAVHGEAELHLRRVIQAFEDGGFDATTLPGLTFRSTEDCDLTQSPIPERWLYKYSRNYMNPGVLEFGRGCQYRCSFCASTNLYTQTLRYKSVGQIIAEIATLPEYPGGVRTWFFGDDNFASSHTRAKELALAIGRIYPRARWGSAMTIASANDPALLDALARGGMRYAFVGFDSVVQKSLEQANKTSVMTRQFRALIREFKQRDIFIVAALVFGFDWDTPSVFRQTLDWAMESGVDALNLNVLRPYPSSPLYKEYRASGRMLQDPWWLQSFETRLSMVHGLTANVSSLMTAYQPRLMTARELAEGTLWVGQEFYKLDRVFKRLFRYRTSIPTMVLDLLTNFLYGREYRSWTPVAPPGH